MEKFPCYRMNRPWNAAIWPNVKSGKWFWKKRGPTPRFWLQVPPPKKCLVFVLGGEREIKFIRASPTASAVTVSESAECNNRLYPTNLARRKVLEGRVAFLRFRGFYKTFWLAVQGYEQKTFLRIGRKRTSRFKKC